MPSPYTIEQTSEMSGLSVKFIRRMKSVMPSLFERHTERGLSNALLFNEEIVEILKRTQELKNRGRTLQQIRDELMELVTSSQMQTEKKVRTEESGFSLDQVVENIDEPVNIANADVSSQSAVRERTVPLTALLKRENTILKSQVDLLQHLLKKSDDRFDRLLPAAGQTFGEPAKKDTLKSQLLMWLVEAVVVTTFAAGFILLIWLFAQKAFRF